MTQNTILLKIVATAFFILVGLSGAVPAADIEKDRASGTLVQGYRILPIEKSVEELNLIVYRGDYIKFDFDANVGEPTLQIPALSVNRELPLTLEEAPYFKMKKTGFFRFSVGSTTGNIQVIEYKQPYYKLVDAREAAELIRNLSPLLLDVRTRSEYGRGHIKDALLIPVQELQKRLGELSDYKHSDILIYCASGNRSTVASKILGDNGFKRITNMRHGIYQWAKSGYPVTK